MTNSNVSVMDYRFNKYCNIKFTIENRKQKFLKQFKENHPRATNFYRYVQPRNSLENKEFRKIYYNRCVYCGVSTQVLPASLFEVDHFLSQSECEKHRLTNVNHIDNLVSSCAMCNRGKSNYSCSHKYMNLLHPDKNQYPMLFYRDANYYLVIKKEYRNNVDVLNLFKALKFDNELRRIDYLIMELKDFCDTYSNDRLACKIKDIIEPIEQLRRDTSI
ncbi:HNH endonuclease [Enterococcus faecalis]|nr:HNH endonuclease [Enterococcus faecalis]